MLDRREIDQIMVAIRECVKECQDAANKREAIEKYLNRLRRRGWPESRVNEVAERVAYLLTGENPLAE
ncbi:MAG TPA: hypothetical protein VMP01_13755 [Pirellulaceae bacterium]|nr:hypothetical protein [Pirellulaceae bacterium]